MVGWCVRFPEFHAGPLCVCELVWYMLDMIWRACIDFDLFVLRLIMDYQTVDQKLKKLMRDDLKCYAEELEGVILGKRLQSTSPKLDHRPT